MKYLLITILFALNVNAKVITENGVNYTCKPELTQAEKQEQSRKREARLKKLEAEKAAAKEKVVEKIVTIVEKEEAPKNIISAYAVRSQNGIDSSSTPSSTTVGSDMDTGLGLMYQRRIKSNVYGGAAADTNGGISLNIGLGF